MEDARKVRIHFSGDGGIGKTTLLIRHVEGMFATEYIPTVFDSYEEIITKNGEPLKYMLYDSAGGEDYAPVRSIPYPQMAIFVLCFNVTCPYSLNSLTNKWIPEIRLKAPKTPFLLVGTKTDLRNDKERLERLLQLQGKNVPYTPEEGIEFAKSIGAVKYLECSSLTGEGVKGVLETAIDIAYSHSYSSHSK